MIVYHGIGLMSGSSLDGLDIAYCKFVKQNAEWNFEILYHQCVPYEQDWLEKLENLDQSSAREYVAINYNYGTYLGQVVNTFIQEFNLPNKVDFIASHGHTIFHEPKIGYTCQIGDGRRLAEYCKIKVINDFRNLDIVRGGQGAPIVPIADKLLFSDFKYCLNIGGIANISIKEKDNILAYDICPANQILNYFARQKGQPYDKDGVYAATGDSDEEILDKLDQIDFYNTAGPKTLSNQFSKEIVIPILENADITIEDKLATALEHIAKQIVRHLKTSSDDDKMLITGGGALNNYLVERLKLLSNIEIVLPDEKIINYKEAVAMAFMGVLRLENQSNVLASVTGASKDSIAGEIFSP